MSNIKPISIAVACRKQSMAVGPSIQRWPRGTPEKFIQLKI